jgi:hypothetical protein
MPSLEFSGWDGISSNLSPFQLEPFILSSDSGSIADSKKIEPKKQSERLSETGC